MAQRPLKAVYERYVATFAGHHSNGMDSARFMKLCKDTMLIDSNFRAHDVDIIFTKSKDINYRKMSYEGFKRAVMLIAEKKFVAVNELIQYLFETTSDGLSYNATIPSENRFYDDRTLYTGVHRKGGPTVVDLDRQDFSRLLNRVPANVRGVKQEMLEAYEKPIQAGRYPQAEELYQPSSSYFPNHSLLSSTSHSRPTTPSRAHGRSQANRQTPSSTMKRRSMSAERASRHTTDSYEPYTSDEPPPVPHYGDARPCSRNSGSVSRHTSPFSDRPIPSNYDQEYAHQYDNLPANRQESYGLPPAPPPSRPYVGYDYGFNDGLSSEHQQQDPYSDRESTVSSHSFKARGTPSMMPGPLPVPLTYTNPEESVDDPKELFRGRTELSEEEFRRWNESQRNSMRHTYSTNSRGDVDMLADGTGADRRQIPPQTTPSVSRSRRGQSDVAGGEDPLSLNKPTVRHSNSTNQTQQSDIFQRQQAEQDYYGAQHRYRVNDDGDGFTDWGRAAGATSSAGAYARIVLNESNRQQARSHGGAYSGRGVEPTGDVHVNTLEEENRAYRRRSNIEERNDEYNKYNNYHNDQTISEHSLNSAGRTRGYSRDISAPEYSSDGPTRGDGFYDSHSQRHDRQPVSRYQDSESQSHQQPSSSQSYSSHKQSRNRQSSLEDTENQDSSTNRNLNYYGPMSAKTQDNSEDIETAVHKTFIGYSDGVNEEMDSMKFVKLCRDAGLMDHQFSTNDADLVFQRSKKSGNYGKRITYHEFRFISVPIIADKKGISITSLMKSISSVSGPSLTNATVPGAVRLHDEVSGYTGVYAAGGPTVVDKDKYVGPNLLDRSQADVRGVKIQSQRHSYRS